MKNQKGFSLVELLVVVIIIGIIAAIAIPSLLSSRRSANEASAISTLRTIHSAQSVYQATQGSGTNYTTLESLSTNADKLLDGSFAAGSPVTKSGYIFTEQGTPTTTYCVAASPSSATTGTRHFGIGVDGVVKFGAAALTCTAGVSTGTVLGSS